MNKYMFILICCCQSVLYGNNWQEERHKITNWTDIENLTISGDVYTKTGVTSVWDGGMFSEGFLPAGEDGYMEYTIETLGQYYMLGFSSVNINAHFSTLEYAWYVRPDRIEIRIGGSTTVSIYDYELGDILRIEKIGSSVTFKRNGIRIPLPRGFGSIENDLKYYIDASFFKLGDHTLNVYASFENTPPNEEHTGNKITKWRDIENLTISGDVYTKTGVTSVWDGGMFSEGYLPAGEDGYMEYTIETLGMYYMLGFSSVNINAHFHTLEYAWYVRPDRIEIRIGGSTTVSIYDYSVQDVLRIEKVGSTVIFKRNGIRIPIPSSLSSIDPNLNYHIDASFFKLGDHTLNVYASFADPVAGYATLKKKLDGSVATFDGDVKFKFRQEYAVDGVEIIYCSIYDWTRQNPYVEQISVQYGTNWLSIPRGPLQSGEIYTLELEGNKGQKYYLKFKYQENQTSWEAPLTE